MLKINPYQLYNTNSSGDYNSKRSFQKNGNVAFGYANKLAKDYAFVKDYESRLYDVICEELGYTDYDILNEAKRLIKNIRASVADKDKQLAEFAQNTEKLNNAINEEMKKQSRLEKEISEIGKLTAIDKLRLSKIIASEERKYAICDMLGKKYVELHKLEQKTYPNGLMIVGLQDASEQQFVLKYLENNNNKIFKINFENIPQHTLIREVGAMFSRIKSEGEQALLYIENFRKYTDSESGNFAFINNLKGSLSRCAKDYKTTILAFDNNPQTLDSAIQGQHRFKWLDVSDIKSEITSCFVPKYDGFTFVYGVNKDDSVDLYLKDFGYNIFNLWIDSHNNKKIRTVIDRIDEIKMQEKFRNIECINFPKPDCFDDKTKYAFETSQLTADFKDKIYGYFV